MKKLIAVSLTMVLLLFAAGSFSPSPAQAPATDDTPTFYRLVPGTYVNGWPRFTVHYPKEWAAERPLMFAAGEVFKISPSGPVPNPRLGVVVVPFPLPLDRFAEALLPAFKAMGATDAAVVTDKASQLPDGTPVREVEIHEVVNGIPLNWLAVAIKKGDTLVHVSVTSLTGKVGEDLKAIPYSVQFQPDKDKPVKLPSDVQEFVDAWGNDVLSHDIAKVMSHVSDRYLHSGVRKGEVERFWRQGVGRVTSAEVVITEFIPAGDMAYVAGSASTNVGKMMLPDTSIIKENGEWKWYGNQRDVAR